MRRRFIQNIKKYSIVRLVYHYSHEDKIVTNILFSNPEHSLDGSKEQ